MTSYAAGLSTVVMRRKQIIDKLKEHGAVSEETAMTLADAKVFNPDAFMGIVDKLVKEKIIGRTVDNRYYVL